MSAAVESIISWLGLLPSPPIADGLFVLVAAFLVVFLFILVVPTFRRPPRTITVQSAYNQGEILENFFLVLNIQWQHWNWKGEE